MRILATNYFLSVAKIFQKFLNNKRVDYLQKCRLSNDFQYGFRPYRLTADFLTVSAYIIATVFNMSVAARDVAHNKSKAFDMVCQASLLDKRKV